MYEAVAAFSTEGPGHLESPEERRVPQDGIRVDYRTVEGAAGATGESWCRSPFQAHFVAL